jgi:hypothetical protein
LAAVKAASAAANIFRLSAALVSCRPAGADRSTHVRTSGVNTLLHDVRRPPTSHDAKSYVSASMTVQVHVSPAQSGARVEEQRERLRLSSSPAILVRQPVWTPSE